MPIQNDINLRSEEVDEILTRPPNWMLRWGNVVILSLVTLILILSWMIKYPDIISAEIVVTTLNPPERIVAATTGQIEALLLKNKSKVAVGDPIAIIENSADYKDVFTLKEILDTLDLTKNNGYYLFESYETMNLGEIAPSFAIFEKNYQAYQLNKVLHPYDKDFMAQSFEKKRLEERLMHYQKQLELGAKELTLKEKEIERYRKLYEKGVISGQEWDTKNMELILVEKNYRSINTSISQAYSSINELNLKSNTSKIDETRDNISLFSSAVQSLGQLRKVIKDWELTYVLKSSTAGELSFLKVWTENQNVSLNENVFTIIPANSKNYIGKMKVSTLNSGKIEVGQQVNIRLANYPDREFGMLQGKIQSISKTPDVDGNLLIDVAIPKNLTTTYKKKIIFRQEMTGGADIVTEDLRLLERFLYQIRNIINK